MHSYCSQQGYTQKDTSTNISSCVFSDGTMCPEFDFFQGNCGLGIPTPPAEEEGKDSDVGTSTLEDDFLQQDISMTGWLGAVYSLPEGGQHDDYVILVPEQAGSFGISGENQDIEKQIINLRDHPEPGKSVNSWGILTCRDCTGDWGGWLDYNGRRDPILTR